MAFYGFKGDADNCFWTPYYTTPGPYYNYDSHPTPFPASDEFGESGSDYYYKDYSFTSPSESDYSLHTFSEPTPNNYYQELSYSNPKFLQYEGPVSDWGSCLPVESNNFRISYSVSPFDEPEFEEYDTTHYSGGGCDPAVTYGKPLPSSDTICYTDYSFASPWESNYSLHTFSEPNLQNYYQELSYSNPKFLQYEAPISDRGSYLPVESNNFRISYSVSEFNEPEFEEYDPTPYGGGYDPAVTYGKPLPPSDTICYPRTLPKPGGRPLDSFSYNSIPSPYGKDEGDGHQKPPNGSKPAGDDVPKKPPNRSKPAQDDVPKKPPNGSKPADTKIDKEAPVVVADVIPSAADVVESSDDVIPGEDCNGVEGDHGDEYERQFDRIPYGSGLESLDLCDSIFGYWPCLTKIEQQQRAKSLEACDHHGRIDPWQSAADYLFGMPAIYGHGNYQQAQHQVYENSWL